MSKNTLFISLVLLLGMGVAACSDEEGDGGDLTAIAKVEIQLSPQNISFSSANLNEEYRRQFIVSNVSFEGAALKVQSIQINQAASDFSITCTRGDTFTLNPNEQSVCEVTFVPSLLEAQTATVTFVSNASNATSGANVLTLSTLQLQQDIEAVPARVAFDAREGQQDQKIVKIRNIGSSPLRITRYDVTGQADLFSATPEGDREISESNPVILNPHDEQIGPTDPGYESNELLIYVTYSPETVGSDSADLKIFSDDPNESVLEVPLTANSNAPCILVVDGTRIDFGNSRIGDLNQRTITVQNCGNADLEIGQLEPGENSGILSDTSSMAPFLIDSGSDDRPIDNEGNLTATPITISPGEVDTFILGYAPTLEEPNNGTMFIHSNDDLNPRLQLDLFGRGVFNQCPTAIAKGTLRDVPAPPSTQVEAAPLQTLILDGSDSTDVDGSVVDWVWEIVERPDGSVAELETVANEPADPARRQLFLDLAGRFVIEMIAIDDGGCSSEETATITAIVVPNEAIHVQVVWNNSADPDQTDTSGSDIDTHFMKMPIGRWFEAPYDNYFANREPFFNPENPSLDIDDTNGAGPENINLDNPNPCQWYAVGIHYWRAQFGTAYTTVRIYIQGGLVFEFPNKPMRTTNEWWDVARIHWPTGEIIAVDEVVAAAPRNQEAPVTQAMIDSNLCGTPQQ
jgi:hypothetical protein